MLLVLFTLLIPWLGEKPFHTRGEGREALVVQSMVEHGFWIQGTGYGGAVPSKPPMMHWIAALVSLPVGEVSEFTARLPSALLSLVLCFSLYRFLRTRTGESSAFLTPLVLITTVEWFRASVTARVDMTLAVTLVGGLLLLYQWLVERKRSALLLSIPLLVAAALTKGPVALLIACGVVGLYVLFDSGSVRLTLLRALLPVLPAALLAGSWYVFAFWIDGERFLEKFWEENFARFAGMMEDDPHRRSPIDLYLWLCVGFLPWTLLLFVTGVSRWAAVRDQVRGWRLRHAHASWRERWLSFAPFTRYALLVCVVTLIFFSFPSSKRGVYLLPAYPFLAFLVVRFLSLVEAPKSVLRLNQVFAVGVLVAGAGLVFLLAGGGSLLAPMLNAAPRAALLGFIRELRQQGAVGALVLVVPMVVAARALVRTGADEFAKVPLVASFALYFSVMLALQAVLFPAGARPLSEERVAQVLRGLEPRPLLSFGFEFYGTSFYLNQRIDRLEDQSVVQPSYLLVRDRDLAEFDALFGDAIATREVARVGPPGVVRIGRLLFVLDARPRLGGDGEEGFR